jgi:hypothetical protein
MPICPHCGQPFQSHVTNATEEEQDLINDNVKKIKRIKFNLKMYPLIIIVSIILLFTDSILFPNMTPFIQGYRKGAYAMGIAALSLIWYYGNKESKKTFPSLKKAGYEI